MQTDNLNTSLIPITSNAVVKAGNSIAITNKLLLETEQQKVIEFFLRHPVFFVKFISRNYPLSEQMFENFFKKMYKKKILYKNLNKIHPRSQNIKISLKTEIALIAISHSIEDFDIVINVMENDKDEKRVWSELSTHKFLPWSIELIEKFKNKWNWDQLSYNCALWKKEFNPFITDEVIEKVFEKLKK